MADENNGNGRRQQFNVGIPHREGYIADAFVVYVHHSLLSEPPTAEVRGKTVTFAPPAIPELYQSLGQRFGERIVVSQSESLSRTPKGAEEKAERQHIAWFINLDTPESAPRAAERPASRRAAPVAKDVPRILSALAKARLDEVVIAAAQAESVETIVVARRRVCDTYGISEADLRALVAEFVG